MNDHNHLSRKMVDILYHLSLHPEPIHSRELARAIGARHLGVATLRPLVIRKFIDCDKGWTITDEGKLKLREEMQAGR
jgi:hypothetical protein